jgi:prevent-host-death family protein
MVTEDGTMAMQEMPAGEFKAKCLQVMDDVQATGRGVVITKRGKPVARLLPIEATPPVSFGALAGTITIVGDIIGPSGEVWDADQ